ncbi:hypothetical protein RB195_019387 [Necator americanus]|uniref:Reverse transcriptase domain-containing protein n=1 Tax=Necator americanus TaxID=51031 RepID=A0ABR1CGG8_NECAM
MECGSRIEDGSIRVDGTELNKVECFKYLGSKVTSTGDIDQEGQARVNAAWMKWKMETGVLCDKKVAVRLKSKIYRTVVCPVTLYGCGCWATTKALERVLHTTEMWMLRWTIGVTLKDKVSNDTVRSIFGVVPIAEKMKEARLRWFPRLAVRGKFCFQNRSEARRCIREAAWEAKDSLVGPCEAGYDRCAFVYS